MNKWRLEITVNGVRTDEIVYAYNAIDAKRLVEWRYYGQRVIVMAYHNA